MIIRVIRIKIQIAEIRMFRAKAISTTRRTAVNELMVSNDRTSSRKRNR
jgi:hypothetical protein